MTDYKAFEAPSWYWKNIIHLKRMAQAFLYHKKNGKFPTEEEILAIELSEEEKETYRKQCYIHSLITEITGPSQPSIPPIEEEQEPIPVVTGNTTGTTKDENDRTVSVDELVGLWECFNMTYQNGEVNMANDKFYIDIKANLSYDIYSTYPIETTKGTIEKDIYLQPVYINDDTVHQKITLLKNEGWTTEYKITHYGHNDEYEKTMWWWGMNNNTILSLRKVLTYEESMGVYKWLELPSMDNPNYQYFTHSFELDGKTYRNFSFAWSEKDHISKWVAFPLDKLYMENNTSRTDAWMYDPLLGQESSSAPFRGYAGSLAREHLCASANRMCCYEANAQCFYGTNIVPAKNELNEGSLYDIDLNMRTLAKASEEAYAVVGTVFTDESTKTVDSDGKSLTIPDYIFKTLLSYRPESEKQWHTYCNVINCITGEIIPMSVNEIEEFAGVTLYPNLKERVGEELYMEIKSQPSETI